MSFRLFYILLIFAAVKCGEGIWAQEEGLASYYHHRFHGRKSSSGRVHDKEELVAAHRTYPFGTFLRVTNLENMKSTIVCVTDRVAKVRIEVVPGPLDLRYLDLIYPKIPYLDIDYLRPDPPYRVKFTK